MHKIVSSETEKAYHATNCKRQKIFTTKYSSIYFFPLYYNTDSWLLTLLCFLFPMLGERIPLTKMKTMRETLREKNLLTNFLLKNNGNWSQKFGNRSQNVAYYPKMTLHPLRNYLDVSVLGGWHSTAPPGALAWHWGSSGGARRCGGARAPAGSRNTGEYGPHSQRRGHSRPQLLVGGNWARQCPGGR